MAVQTEDELVIDRSHHWTAEELYERWPDDHRRREIIDGVLYVSPGARVRHQYVVGRIFRYLDRWTQEHGGLALPGANVDLVDGSHLEPDVVFLLPGHEQLDGLALLRPPDVVVEVSSRSTKRFDQGLKRERYARHGAPEFWFADLDEEMIRVWRLGHGDEPECYARGDVVTSPLLPGFAMDVNDALGPQTG